MHVIILDIEIVLNTLKPGRPKAHLNNVDKSEFQLG